MKQTIQLLLISALSTSSATRSGELNWSMFWDTWQQQQISLQNSEIIWTTHKSMKLTL